MGAIISMDALAAVLPSLLTYEPDTGKLFWLERPGAPKQWNARFARREAFTAKNCSGYHHGTLMGRTISAHRAIWCLQTGEWPSDQVDHVNLDRSDNRWSNLRSATRSENNRNTRSRPNASSRFIGVQFHRLSGKWAARIRLGGKQKYLGIFADEIAAANAYDAAVLKSGDQFMRRNFIGGEA